MTSDKVNSIPKRILITGKNSYIGINLKEWLEQYPEKYQVDAISVRGDLWKEESFSGYDVIVHVAGIAHVRETRNNRDLYYHVNRDLAYEVAIKAKQDGVKHFLFLSSISIFGIKDGIITDTTVPNPKNHYGKSKLEAEKLIIELVDNAFKVSIVRPPMVYGNGCKGNYPRLAQLAKRTPVFPKTNNQRSVIFIDNLSECIRSFIDEFESGVYHPQNSHYVSTQQLVESIALSHGKKVFFTGAFNWLIRIGMYFFDFLKKIFGTLVYDMDMSVTCDVLSFQESIFVAENSKGI